MRATGPIVPRVEVRPRKPLWEEGLMTLDESIQGMRLQVIRRAAAIGVSTACREAGISRTLFYRWQTRLAEYGVDGPHPRRQRARSGPRPELPPHAERQILGLAQAQATWGCRRLAAYLARWWRLHLAPSTVQRLLHRYGLPTRRDRLLVLEHQCAPGGAAHRADATRALARAARDDVACGRRAAGRARLPGHVLHRQSQRRRQGVADHSLRCRQLVRGRRHLAGVHAGGKRGVPSRYAR